MSKKKFKRFPDYDVVVMKDVITFGTTLFIRKDKKALKIVFPAGQTVTFAPQDEIQEEKSGKISSFDLSPTVQKPPLANK